VCGINETMFCMTCVKKKMKKKNWWCEGCCVKETMNITGTSHIDDIIYKHLHRSYMKDLNKHFKMFLVVEFDKFWFKKMHPHNGFVRNGQVILIAHKNVNVFMEHCSRFIDLDDEDTFHLLEYAYTHFTNLGDFLNYVEYRLDECNSDILKTLSKAYMMPDWF
jgi:hypothetical protein